jgi:hypothetical protein
MVVKVVVICVWSVCMSVWAVPGRFFQSLPIGKFFQSLPVPYGVFWGVGGKGEPGEARGKGANMGGGGQHGRGGANTRGGTGGEGPGKCITHRVHTN